MKREKFKDAVSLILVAAILIASVSEQLDRAREAETAARYELPPEGGATKPATQSQAPVAAGWSECFGLFIQIDDVSRATETKRLKCAQNPEVRIACGERAVMMSFTEFCKRIFEDQAPKQKAKKR